MYMKVLDIFLFLYIFGSFVISKIENFSIVTNLLLLILVFLNLYKAVNIRIMFSWFLILQSLLMFVSFASVFWSYDFDSAALMSASFSTALIGGATVMITLMNNGSIKSVFRGALLGSAILLFSGWREMTVQNVLRASGLAENANALGISLSIAVFLIINPIQRQSVFSIVYCIFLLSFSLFGTASRKMILVVVALSGYLGYSLMRSILTSPKRLRSILFLAVTVLLIVVFLNFLTPTLEDTVLWRRTERALVGTDGSVSTRQSMITYGIELWVNKPILGYGVNQFKFVGAWGKYSHNNYIEILINTGIVGLMLYYSIFFALLILVVNRLSGKHRIFALSNLILLLMWDTAFVSYYSKLVWICVGVLVFMVSTHKPNQHNRQ